MRLKFVPWILLQNVGPIPGWDDPDAMVELPDGFLPADASATASGAPNAQETALLKSKAEKDPLAHLRYLRYLQRHQPRQTEIEKYGSGYQDYLQVPLQPLTHDLESLTYEVFEKDPVKYDLYEEAISRALQDWVKSRKEPSIPGSIVVAVVGAGRGPLVTRALKAADAAHIQIDLWVVEKNPHAYLLLQRHNREQWNNRAHLVHSDMRTWAGPEIASHSRSGPRTTHGTIDIVISELLGSFGDNELSPECLDFATSHLSPHGLSIPRDYTAFMTPVAAPRIHADVAARMAADPNAAETPAVVWLHSIDYVSGTNPPVRSAEPAADPRHRPSAAAASKVVPNVVPAWTFTHGPRTQPGSSDQNTTADASNVANRRQARLTFRVARRAVCHGLAGYFEATLYPGVVLSTNPITMERYSKDMISWFPIFFPLKVCKLLLLLQSEHG